MLTSVFSLCLFLLYFILYLFLASSDINRYLFCGNVKYTPIGYKSEVILIEKFPKGHNAYNCYEWHIWSWLCYKWHIYWRMVSSSYGLCLIYWTLTFNPSVYWSEVKTDNIGVCIGLYKYSLFGFELFSFWSFLSVKLVL